MSEPKITALRYTPKPRSPWGLLRVGMTHEEVCTLLGRSRRELSERVRCGQIVFDPPIPGFARHVQPKRAPVSYVNRDGAKLRECLCCRTPFESTGPGNRMCDHCRGKSVSPFAPG